MTLFTKQTFAAGFFAATILASPAMAQSVEIDNAKPFDPAKIVTVSLDINQQMATQHSVLNAKFTTLIETRMAERLQKIENEPPASNRGLLVLAER